MARLNDQALAEAHGEMMYWDQIYRRCGGVYHLSCNSRIMLEYQRGSTNEDVLLQQMTEFRHCIGALKSYFVLECSTAVEHFRMDVK